MRFRQVHLDFHTSEHIRGIGESFDPAHFQAMLKKGHVDSITVFAKCHHGWAYHPSTANETHPHLKFDLLGAQIKAAHEIGVKTPVYISVGLDEKIARKHTEWLRREQNESIPWAMDFMNPGWHEFCLNSPYLDVVLAQIEEVVTNYDCDGLFLDIVGVRTCWCQNCVRELLEQGKDPRDHSAVAELGEKTYKNYYEKVIETVNAIKPGLPIFQNSGHVTKGRRDLAYANTHLELESLPTGGWGYDHFPASARYAETLEPKMEYLGMTGKFHRSWGEFGGFKHPNALRYETALSIANGAKCSIGDQLHPDGKMDERTYGLIGAAYAEVELKEAWCDNSTNIADIAIMSQEANAAVSADPWNSNFQGDIGAARIMLEGKYLFDMVDGEADLSKYKLLVLPDSILVNDGLAAKIENFTKEGGYIIASGMSGFCPDKSCPKLDFGVKDVEDCGFSPTYAAVNNEPPVLLYGKAYKFDLVGNDNDYTVLAERLNPYFNRDALHFCSHQHAPYDKTTAKPGIVRNGNAIYCGWEIFTEYADFGSITTKELILMMIENLIGDKKTVKTNLGAQGTVTLRKQEREGRYIFHALYAAPVKRGKNIEIIEDLLPVLDTEVEIAMEKMPKKAYLAPQDEDIGMSYKNGKVKFRIDKFTCHQMVVINI